MLARTASGQVKSRFTIHLATIASLGLALAVVGAQAHLQPPAGQGRTVAAGERLRISIVGLMAEGVESRLTRRVEASGALRLPKLDASRFDATTMTAAELETAITRLYEQQTTLNVKLVVVSRLDAGEDHALDGWREPPDAERYGGFVVRGLVAPWPAVLAEPLGVPMDLDEVPFRDVIQTFHERTKLTVVVDWATLKFDGVDETSAVNLHVPPDVSIGRAIQMTLDAAAPQEHLRYDWVEGVLTISRPDDDRHTQTMVVNVSSLLNVQHGDDRAPHDEQVERIVDLITESVASDVWQTNGGDSGSVEALEERLVITAPPWVLREVLELLNKVSR